MTIQALFVETTGVYFGLLGPENCWDQTRDARNYKGAEPCIAHPPCQLWTNFAALNYKRYGGDHNKPGNDGGCFAHALACVREFGGVLEHPGSSNAWKAYGLKRPVKGQGWGWGQQDMYKGMTEYTCELFQSAYGHKAAKRTFLLYCGKQPPFQLNWEKVAGTYQIGWFDRIKPTLGKKEASRTPVAFAKELIRLAEWSRG